MNCSIETLHKQGVICKIHGVKTRCYHDPESNFLYTMERISPGTKVSIPGVGDFEAIENDDTQLVTKYSLRDWPIQ